MRAWIIAALLVTSGVNVAAAADFKPFVRGSWSDILKSHAGHPTIVHFWAMTCGPCRIEMPRWGAFLAAHPGADVVTIDTDVGPAAPGAAEAFLVSAKMPTNDAWRFADADAERLYFSVDPTWQGEIPMTLFVGRDGLVTKTIGGVAMDDVETWMKAQAAAPQSAR